MSYIYIPKRRCVDCKKGLRRNEKDRCPTCKNVWDMYSPKNYACTECGGDAFIGYGSDKKDGWGGMTKKGERLCTRCFKKRGGISIF